MHYQQFYDWIRIASDVLGRAESNADSGAVSFSEMKEMISKINDKIISRWFDSFQLKRKIINYLDKMDR